MKRFFITVIAFFAISQMSFARDKVFVKNDIVTSATLGFYKTIHNGFAGSSVTVPPIALSGDYGVVDNLINGNASIGVGLGLGCFGTKFNTGRSADLIIAAKGAFHYQFVKKLDTYAGLMLGYDIVTRHSPYPSQFVWGFYVGGRYYFTDKFAVTVEIGDNVSLLSAGVAFKL
jgi:hypothetical protein